MCVAVVLLLVTAVLALVTQDAPADKGAVATAAEFDTASSPTVSTPSATEPPATESPSTAATEPPTTAPSTTEAPSTAPAAAATGTAKPAADKSATTAPPSTLLPPITLPPLLAPPTTAAPPPPAAAPTGGIAPYLGLGTWVDVYDWSVLYAKGGPTVTPGEIDQMASAGVQTLYLQASKHDSPTDILEPDLLQAFIDKAKSRGLRVVVWYLPTLVDTDADLRRLKAVASLPNIDGVAVDIEARNVTDIAERNRRLVALTGALRQALPGRTIGAIVLPPVALEVINPNYWPAFPYRQIAPFFDVWMTMSYWTNRTDASGYRDAYRYTKENVERLRNNLGQPDAPVHPVGGIGPRTTAADVEGYKVAVTQVHGIGGSIYDWETTAPGLWDNLRTMRLQ